MKQEEIVEEILESQPVLEYAWLKPSEIEFSDRVRYVCEHECPRYNSSWSCPPAVGTVSECRERVNAFDGCFVFSTISEVEDITDMEGTLAHRVDHETVTHAITDLMKQHFDEVLTLSTESCAICKVCQWPGGPCIHPERMFPAAEGYGIVVANVAENAGMTFNNGENIATWFSFILYKEKKEK